MKFISLLIIAALFSVASAAEPSASSQLSNHFRKGESQHLEVYSAWVDQAQAIIEVGFPKLCSVILATALLCVSSRPAFHSEVCALRTCFPIH